MSRILSLVVAAALLPELAACGRRPAEGQQPDSRPALTAGQPGRPRGAAADERGTGGRGGRRRGRGWGATILQFTDAEARAIGVQTVTVAARPLESRLRAMGQLTVPQPRKAIVSCAFSGRISRIAAGIGAWVSKGQPVVSLQSDEIGNAKAEYHKAQAALELARRSLEREKSLFDRGVGAQKNYLAAENDFKVAEATLMAADRRLHVLGFSEPEVVRIGATHQIDSEITLYAPIEGKVVEITAVLGAMVDASHEILTLVDPRVLWVDAAVYERDIALIRLGQRATVQVPAYAGQTFEGTITYIGDMVQPDTRTIAVRTEVHNQDQRLKPGMFADVIFQIDQRRSVLALPEEAILDDQDGHLVFVRTAGGYVPRLVELGVKDDGHREVVGGLAAGDVVVTNGHYQLKSKLFADALKSGHTH